MVAREEGCGLLQCAKLQRQPRSGETAARRSAIEKRFRSRWRLGRVAQEQEMKKTPNAQRSTLNVHCSNLILLLSVGCWMLDVGRSLLLQEMDLPSRNILWRIVGLIIGGIFI